MMMMVMMMEPLFVSCCRCCWSCENLRREFLSCLENIKGYGISPPLIVCLAIVSFKRLAIIIIAIIKKYIYISYFHTEWRAHCALQKSTRHKKKSSGRSRISSVLWSGRTMDAQIYPFSLVQLLHIQYSNLFFWYTRHNINYIIDWRLTNLHNHEADCLLQAKDRTNLHT